MPLSPGRRLRLRLGVRFDAGRPSLFAPTSAGSAR